MKNKFEINGNVVTIFITRKNGLVLKCFVDIDSYNKKLKDFDIGWYSVWDADIQNYYVRGSLYSKRKDGSHYCKMLYMHRYIVDAKKGYCVDHYDHNSLNNVISNLKVTVGGNNSKNRMGKNSNNKSGHRNVSWSKSINKWVVQLQINGKNHLFKETFDDVDEAGEFAEEMRNKYYGEFKGNG